MSDIKTTTTEEVTDDMIPDFTVTIAGVTLTKDRVLATLRALFMVATTIATMTGFEVNLDSIYQFILVLLMAVSMVWGYWKNNNWTKEAIKAQQYQNDLKASNKQ